MDRGTEPPAHLSARRGSLRGKPVPPGPARRCEAAESRNNHKVAHWHCVSLVALAQPCPSRGQGRIDRAAPCEGRTRPGTEIWRTFPSPQKKAESRIGGGIEKYCRLGNNLDDFAGQIGLKRRTPAGRGASSGPSPRDRTQWRIMGWSYWRLGRR